MNRLETIENAKQNIRQAITDYGAHANSSEVLDDITSDFIARLAKDSTNAKSELRTLFSKSPAWDDRLDALVINGTRTHNPDPDLINSLGHKILKRAFVKYACYDAMTHQLYEAVDFFAYPGRNPERGVEAIKALAPKAYAPAKKPSRIFKAICDALQVSDDTAGSEFQRLYAQFADELTAKKIGFKLFVSLNPAHFLTMSNPKGDTRGSTLTSCHSLNSTEYEYNGGCAGYARDEVSFIAFTVADPRIPDALNNRKTTRQIFAYKPGNGLLLQSRLYNTGGGTHGAQEESQLYRDLIQRELSDLEDVPNLWKTYPYLDGKEHCVKTGDGFCGYPDWQYSDFEGKVSIRADCAETYGELTVGTFGLCIRCGDEVNSGLYCYSCGENTERCAYCDETCVDTYTVYDDNGNAIEVCGYCRDEHFSYCERCEEYHSENSVGYICGQSICDNCRDQYYTQCADCGEWNENDEVYSVTDLRGGRVDVCRSCLDDHYVECYHCEEYVHTDRIFAAHDADGNTIEICDECRNGHYEWCDKCGELFDAVKMKNGLCPDCRNIESEDAE